MNTNDTIDILIPAYNCENYIEKCLNSLLNQTYKNLNIIIVNDGSTDNTGEVLKKFEYNYSNIRIYTKANDKSISKTRNFLLKKIENKFFTFMDADDYVEPNYIETLMKILKTYNADMSICSRARHKDKRKINLYKKNMKLNEISIFNQEEAIAEMLSSTLFNGSPCCKIFKTELLKDISFDENIHYGEDLDFCFKYMQNCNKFVFSNKKLYHYIVRKNSIVTSKFKESKLTLVDCYKKIIYSVRGNELLLTCAKSRLCFVATELLFFAWKARYKNKIVKKNLKKLIKENMPYIKRDKRLSSIFRCAPLVLWTTYLL